ncbi:MAG TPA: adenylate/guanylate cyclase domain-containing protein [Burkholderiales bacterium]|nr:adenylate/guanylate cyclase domain-containing protein [Burkholderiales bacterium]
MKQRLTAIMAADAAGYSRLMASDQKRALAALDACRDVFRGLVQAPAGRIVDTAGDSVLAVFDSATEAVLAALAIQKQLEAAAPELRYRIGIHIGDVAEKDDGSVYGDGVNVAARLQALSKPGEVAVSDAVRMAVRGRVDALFVDQGEQAVKNIPSPVRWYSVVPPHAMGGLPDPRARTVGEVAALPSIALLPFKAAGTDAGESAFADGLRVDIQGALVKIAGLALTAVGTTNTYRNKDVSPQQAASEMGVRYILEGLVQKAGQRARIHMTLTDGPAARAIWSEHYDCVLDETFEAQDDITEKVVTALDVRLMSGEQARVWRKNLKQPRAREHWYRGIHEFMKGQKEANAAAREDFERVAKLAPESSLGPTMVAFTHWLDVFRGWSPSPQKSLELAAHSAGPAMAMDDADGQAHAVMGHIHLLRREHEKALEVAEQATCLRPSCANSNAQFSNILYYCGRPAEAADRVRQAMRFSPVHPPFFKAVLAASCKELREWDDAAKAAKDLLRMKPDDADARLVLIEAALACGDKAGAGQYVEEIRKLQPQFSLDAWAARQPYRDAAVLERILGRLREAGLS